MIARPTQDVLERPPRRFAELAKEWGIVLTDAQRERLDDLPALVEGVVGSTVLVAMEAKAAMTAHTKARPRLYDELNSSHLTVHGGVSSGARRRLRHGQYGGDLH